MTEFKEKANVIKRYLFTKYYELQFIYSADKCSVIVDNIIFSNKETNFTLPIVSVHNNGSVITKQVNIINKRLLNEVQIKHDIIPNNVEEVDVKHYSIILIITIIITIIVIYLFRNKIGIARNACEDKSREKKKSLNTKPTKTCSIPRGEVLSQRITATATAKDTADIEM